MSDALISRTSKSNKISIVQETGSSSTSVMSQNASTNSFATKTHSHSVSDLTSGTLSVSRGGTGKTSLTSGAILLGNGTSGISTTSTLSVSKGGTGQSTLTSGAILLGNGTNGITTTSTLSVSKGGTGKTSLTSGAILLGNGTSGITTTSTLPIDKGGTGATTSGSALSNLGLPKESGSWTPSINASGVSYNSRIGYYERIGSMIFVFCYLVFNITNAGSDYAQVKGLPFTAFGELKIGFNLVDSANCNTGNTAHIRIANHWGGTSVNVCNADGGTKLKWNTGNDKYLVFSGWYVKG